MTVAYNGAGFYGFAANEGVRTVGGTLSDALERVLGHRVKIVCAGRTDRGVHAREQVISFDAASQRVDVDGLTRSVNRMCGPEIAVSRVEIAAPDFDARFSCTARVYRYRVLNTPIADPLAAGFCWHVERPLDIAAMREAASLIVGVHDFSSFCRRSRSNPGQSMVREVRRALWWREGSMVVFEVEARSFCHQMVRSIVSLLVEVGRARREPADVRAALEARRRDAAVSPAPPHGLVLWSALYG